MEASDKIVIDRMLGAIFGHALGDAIGLPNEYAKGPVTWPHDKPHRGFPTNDWSDKTDHMILTMRAVLNGFKPDNELRPISELMAEQLVAWSKNGIAECGDITPAGFGGALQLVMTEPTFETQPRDAAVAVWERSKRVMCTNAHLCRSVPIGLIKRDEVAHAAMTLALTTHADPRCVISAMIHALFINGLVFSEDPIQLVLTNACRDAMSCTQSEAATSMATSDAIQAGFTGDLASLGLDGDGSSSALKCLSVAAYAMQVLNRAQSAGRQPSFFKVIRAIASAGGSASANCGLAGSIIGSAIGYSRLPGAELLPSASYLAELSANYIDTVLASEKSSGDTTPITRPVTATICHEVPAPCGER